MASNPSLTDPPFTTIPGVSPTAPISAQVEQIDQLNTLLLQEIDANFAKFHTIITSKVLPEFKRFAIASEPVREAAQFWNSFFEAASAIRVHVPGDTTTTNETRSNLSDSGGEDDGDEEHDRIADETIRIEGDPYLSRAQAEGSFMFHDGDHVSSTPVPGGRASSRSKRNQQVEDDYDDTLESPFETVERKLDGLKLGPQNESSDLPTPSLPSGYTMPVFDIRRDDLDIGDVSTGTVERDLPSEPSRPTGPFTTTTSKGGSSSRKSGPSGTTPRAAPTQRPTGVTDLRTTPLNHKFKMKKPKQSIANTIIAEMSDLDHEFPSSPPVTMSWQLPPRTQAIMNVGRTPVKSSTQSGAVGDAKGKAREVDGARRIIDDLMEELQTSYSPKVATPDIFRRYSVVPEAVEGEGKILFQGDHHLHHQAGKSGIPASTAMSGPNPTTGRLSQPGRSSRRSIANTSFGSDIVDEPHEQPTPITDESFDEEDSADIDSVFGGGGTIQQMPGMAHHSDLLGNDSFDSSPGSVRGGGGHHGHPDDDDHNDMITTRSEAGMIFGHADTKANVQGPGAKRPTGSGAFNLHKQDEMSTFHGGQLLDAAGREVRHSPLVVGRGGLKSDGADLFNGRLAK